MVKKHPFFLIIALVAVFLCSFTFVSDAETISDDAGSWSYTLDDDGMLTFSMNDDPNYMSPTLYFKKYADRITGIQFSGQVKAPTSLDFSHYWGTDELDIRSIFKDLKNLKTIDLTNLDTSETILTSHMFYGCESLEKVDMSMLTLQTTVCFTSMFEGCSNLKEVVFPDLYPVYIEPTTDVFKGCEKLEKVYFGRNGASSNPADNDSEGYTVVAFMLPNPNPSEFTGRWINTETNQALTPLEWAQNYRVYPEGTYIAERRKFNVKFDTKGGSKVDSQMVDYGAKAKEPEVPTREGFKFEGWYFKGKKFAFNTPINEPTTLFARWSKDAQEKYILRYPDGSTKTTNDYAEAQRLLDQWELLASDLETDENGNIILEDWMKGGNVRIEETKVPEGYKEETVVVETSIDADGVEIINEKVKGAYDDESEDKSETKGAATDDSSDILFYILTAVFGSSLLTILVLRRKIEAKKLMTILLVFGIAASIVYALPQNANAKTDSIDSFEIDKIDQYKEPVQCAVFSIYGKPILETEKEKTEISVKKVWDDDNNSGQFRPGSVTVNLMANDEKVDSVELSESNDWEHTFKELAESDENGPIDYYVEEKEHDRYYGTLEYKDGVFVITNRPKVPLTISKSAYGWMDNTIEKLTLSILNDDGNTISSWDFDSSYASSPDAPTNYQSELIYLVPGKYSFKEELTPKSFRNLSFEEAHGLGDFFHRWQECEIEVNEDGTVNITPGDVREDKYTGEQKQVGEDLYDVVYYKYSRVSEDHASMIEQTSGDDNECVLLIDNTWGPVWK